MIHLDGAIATLLEVYQSLSDAKDSQLLVHLSAIVAGLCSKPTKQTIPKLFAMVPVLLARFKHCAHTLVVAYICTALGRLCDGQPAVAVAIMPVLLCSRARAVAASESISVGAPTPLRSGRCRRC